MHGNGILNILHTLWHDHCNHIHYMTLWFLLIAIAFLFALVFICRFVIFCIFSLPLFSKLFPFRKTATICSRCKWTNIGCIHVSLYIRMCKRALTNFPSTCCDSLMSAATCWLLSQHSAVLWQYTHCNLYHTHLSLAPEIYDSYFKVLFPDISYRLSSWRRIKLLSG